MDSARRFGQHCGVSGGAHPAWEPAATLKGWASADILGSYDRERRPITDQASHLIADVAKRVIRQRCEISADIERQDSVGEAARARVGREAYALDVQQQCCGGLNFGYFY